MNNDWHSLNEQDVLSLLNTSKNGLSNDEVARRQEQYGKNIIPKEKEPNIVQIFLRQFVSPMIIVLMVAAIICFIVGDLKDGIIIGVVLTVNALLGAVQENKAIKSAAAIQKLLTIKAEVLRDGRKIELDSEELVPGDIVFFDSGDKVPADVRLLEVQSLQVDEAFLTGESIGVAKNTKEARKEAPVTDRFNMCFASSTIESGRAKGVVVLTGKNTEIGTIAENLREAKEAKSPLTIRLKKFTYLILILVSIFSVIATLIMIGQGYGSHEIFMLIIAMCVSAIPESLPIVQTVVLSIATSKMSKNNVIVKKLSSVESLGSCTIIASDKTGTLTVNQQTAKIISIPDGTTFEVSGEGYNDKGSIIFNEVNNYHTEQVKELCKMGFINNEAFLENRGGEFVHHGDSIDLAFLCLGLKKGLSEIEVKQELNVFGSIPYESENKFSASFFERNNTKYVTVKGSSETILELCTKQKMNDSDIPIEYEKLEKEFLRLSALGFRVIALATGEYNGEQKEEYTKEDMKELTFIGFVGFIDPIRNTSKNSIETCQKAGIRVIMITGDHPLTAKVISQELNLIDETGIAITGDVVEDAYNNSKEDLLNLLTKNNVFARVSPLQKAIIVETFKDAGEFIAVTGDGINDAPALKKANIGVAMGSGTDVAKDVSTMIITDDNFMSIVTAVKYGRYAYSNFRKVVWLLITAAFAEMTLFMASIIFGLPPVFTAVQILWINLCTNGIQDLAIATEKGEEGVMEDKPRPTNQPLFDRLLRRQTIIAAGTMFLIVFLTWFVLNTRFNIPVEEARNYVLLLMVLLQNVNAFNCRSERKSMFKIPLRNNRWILLAVSFALGLHILFMFTPGLQGVLNTGPISLSMFGVLLLMTIPFLLVMESMKLFNRAKEEKKSNE